MDARTGISFPEKAFWFLGAGGFLSLIWWGLALASDPLAKIHSWPSLVITIGGFILALPGLIWLKNSKPINKHNGKTAPFWLTLSILYPLALLVLFIRRNLGSSALGWLAFLTHPAMLTINLAACLLIGPILNRFGGHLNRGVVWAVWWLWQLPLIFINGSALLQYHFSNLLMFLYLATVLSLSFWLFLYPMENK